MWAKYGILYAIYILMKKLVAQDIHHKKTYKNKEALGYICNICKLLYCVSVCGVRILSSTLEY